MTDESAEDQDAEEAIDGRSARRDRNRLAVLDAVISLFGENNLVPDVHDVVERSGVSLRSVYRYFEDREALLYAAMERNRERSFEVGGLPSIGHGPRAERIDSLVAQRFRLYAVLGPTYRASFALAARNAAVRNEFDVSVLLLRSQLEAHFAPELNSLPASARATRLDALDVATQFSTMDHLCRVLNIEPAKAADSMAEAARLLLLDIAEA